MSGRDRCVAVIFAGRCACGGLPGAARARRVISATGIQPELLRRHSMERGCSPTVLRGSSAEVSSDDLPVVGVQTGGRCRMTTCVGIPRRRCVRLRHYNSPVSTYEMDLTADRLMSRSDSCARFARTAVPLLRRETLERRTLDRKNRTAEDSRPAIGYWYVKILESA